MADQDLMASAVSRMPIGSASSCSTSVPRSVGGAIGATPTRSSSGEYVGASSAAYTVAWPPCEWPYTAVVALTSSPSKACAARTLSSTDRPSLSPMRYGCGPGVPRPG